MNKKGFTLIELLVSIAVIGILLTIGYKGYTIIVANAKASKVVSEIDKVKQAIANTLGQTGGYYQNADGYGPDFLQEENPGTNCGSSASDKDATIEYVGSSGAVKDTSCFGHKIERVFHEQLLSMGFKWVPKTSDPNQGQFRLNSFPLAKLVFPMQVNGVRTFKIQGIPGNIAMRVLKKINESDRIIKQDGWTRANPVAIISYPASKPGVEKNCLNSLSTLNTVRLSFICEATGQTSASNAYGNKNTKSILFEPGSESKVANYAQVGLIYTYSFGDRWDGAGGADDSTGTGSGSSSGSSSFKE